jgi:hypothetical protein
LKSRFLSDAASGSRIKASEHACLAHETRYREGSSARGQRADGSPSTMASRPRPR